MQILKRKIDKLVEQNKTINVMVIGVGFMGTSLIVQLNKLPGFKCNIASSRDNNKTINAFIQSGADKNKIKNIKKCEEYGNDDDFFVTDNPYEFFKCKDIDVIVDATGSTYEGAQIAYKAITSKKHMVSLNVETDVVIGPILSKLAEKNNVVYTGIAGDEPGSIKELIDFAEFLGFEVVAAGKGKNNPLVYEADGNSLISEAQEKGLSPNMLATFVDGSKTMEELTAVCNATGFKPPYNGVSGIKSDINNLCEKIQEQYKKELSDGRKFVEYVMGIAPGVFIMVKTDEPIIDHEMQFLKIGKGPYYILYRPYHLTSIEVPITIAQAYFFGVETIRPIKQYADTVAVAKKELNIGDDLDLAGGKSVYGKILDYKKSRDNKYLPYGFVSDKITVNRNIKQGEIIKYSDVNMPNSLLLDLRKQLESLTFDSI